MRSIGDKIAFRTGVVVLLLTASSLQIENRWMKTFSPTTSVFEAGLSSEEDKPGVNATLHWDVCLEGANKQLQNWTDYWYNQKYVIFAAATVAPPRSNYSAKAFRNQTWMYHLTFTSFRGSGKFTEAKPIRGVFQHRFGQKWYCVDKNQSRVPAQVPQPCQGYTLTLICPTSMELDQMQVEIRRRWQQKFSYPPVISYNVQPHVDCARQRMHTSQRATHPQPNIVACTLIKGDGPRKILPQWIEYHRMIGIERFMVYLHEPYQSGLPKLPYVEYIPFDVEGQVVQKAVFLFQLSQQHDCLLRARAMGSKWVATHDVDEYIHVMGLNSTADNASVSLLSILEKAVVEKPGLGAMRLSEANFGRRLSPEEGAFVNGTAGFNGNNYNNSPPALEIDYVYHGPVLATGGKVIMRPENVKYTSVHELVSGGPEERIDPSVVRINHFKRPHLYREGRRYLDTSMRDAYRDRLFDRLKQLRTGE